MAPQNLVTSESHQPAAKQAVADKSSIGKVVIKDPEDTLQTFSVWTAGVRGTTESIQAIALHGFPIWQGTLSHPVPVPELLQLLNLQGLPLSCQ